MEDGDTFMGTDERFNWLTRSLLQVCHYAMVQSDFGGDTVGIDTRQFMKAFYRRDEDTGHQQMANDWSLAPSGWLEDPNHEFDVGDMSRFEARTETLKEWEALEAYNSSFIPEISVARQRAAETGVGKRKRGNGKGTSHVSSKRCVRWCKTLTHTAGKGKPRKKTKR